MLAELNRRIDARGLGDHVTLVGPVPHDRVWDEYAAADVFVYPSRVESFGLPPLEAMAAGVPVVASDAPGVAEVVGGAARVVDVTDADALAAAIAELLTAESVRRELARGGAQRAADLSWDRAAERLAEVLRGVARS
jgi:glycosyltransferase involved in cell wall biosynthesis